MNKFTLFCKAATIALVVSVAASVQASGMQGQPAPKPTDARKVEQLAIDIVRVGGDAASARPTLLTMIEATPDADLSDRFAPALQDENTFTAILATYDDALADTTDDKTKTFIRFNALRTIVDRSFFLTSTTRRKLLDRATSLAEQLASSNRGDAAIWEATGDLYALKSDMTNAVAAYKRMGTAEGGSSVYAQYKIARGYQWQRSYGAAQQAYEEGIRADAAQSAGGGKERRHLLYQGLTSLYLMQGRNKEAAEALLLSTRVKPDPDAPYLLRLEQAVELLHRGYAKEVRDYADAALKMSPDDDGAKRLRDAAVAAIR